MKNVLHAKCVGIPTLLKFGLTGKVIGCCDYTLRKQNRVTVTLMGAAYCITPQNFVLQHPFTMCQGAMIAPL